MYKRVYKMEYMLLHSCFLDSVCSFLTAYSLTGKAHPEYNDLQIG